MAMALTCPHLQRSNIQRVVGYMLMRHVDMSHQLLCRMSTVVGEGQSFICACRDAEMHAECRMQNAERECRVSNPNPNPVFYYFFTRRPGETKIFTIQDKRPQTVVTIYVRIPCNMNATFLLLMSWAFCLPQPLSVATPDTFNGSRIFVLQGDHFVSSY